MKVKELIKNNSRNIYFSKQASSFLKKLPKKISGNIIQHIHVALNNKNYLYPLKGRPIKYKVRAGKIRVILEKDPKTVKIRAIKYRKDVYS